MNASNMADTQPVKVHSPAPSKSKRKNFWFLALLIILLISLGATSGALAGYRSGRQALEGIRTEQLEASLKEQFDLGVGDLEAGRYEIARQRFQYIFDKKPDYPGLADKMAAVLTILYATATPTPITPTPITPTVTLTPTRDLRPVQDRFSQAIDNLRNSAWDDTIDVLLSLRKEEPAFQTTRVDGLLYLALRQRGVYKIYQGSSLEGGIYDLSLAENFGPLDIDAEVARNLARLYLYGSSFWEAYPELAVYYFGQVAAAAPYLRDASGWTATERYRSALIQYGDQLAGLDDWCSALEQYQLAASIRGDAALSTVMENAALRCSPPTETPADSPTPSPIPGLTPTITLTPPVIPPTETETPTNPPSPTDTPTETQSPPTDTPVPPPTDTPTATEVPPPAP